MTMYGNSGCFPGRSRKSAWIAACAHYLGRLSNAVHLADLFFEPEKTLAGGVRPARAPMTWLHRLLLGFGRKRFHYRSV